MSDFTQTGFNTKSLHFGHDIDETGSRAVPIYQTTSYIFKNADHAADLFSLAEPGNIYTRIMNPTNDVLEKRIAELEGGIAGLTFASGSAAIVGTLLTLLKSGDHIVASNSLYGGTYNLLKVFLPRLNINTTFVDQQNLEEIRKAFKDNTKVFFTESIGNPKLDVPDFLNISAITKEKKVPFIVDNTVATPYLLKPIEFGANIVIHSLTKFIGGHGNSIGGIVIDAGNFDWSNGNFPEFTSPSPGYHGLNYWEVLGHQSFIAKARIETLRDTGAAISPQNSFLILQGLETLSLRIERQSENAKKIVDFLNQHELVKWVSYPFFESNKGYKNAKKYLNKYGGALVTFGLKGGYEAAKYTINSVNVFSLLANIGDSKSLIIHPASTTHQQLSEQEKIDTGVTNDLIRLSIGIENVEDLIKDLKNAIEGYIHLDKAS